MRRYLAFACLLVAGVLVAANWTSSSGQVVVATKFAPWPPSPELQWSASSPKFSLPAGQDKVVYTVPADRILVVTDVGLFGSDTGDVELWKGGATPELQVAAGQLWNTAGASLPIHHLSGSYGIGCVFEAGTQVVLKAPPSASISFTMLGYFVR